MKPLITMREPRGRLSNRQRGMSLVEMMVGLVVGLFVVGGAIALTTANLNESRRTTLEMRLNQDLRAAADLVARDLRRAGYWRNATSGVWSSGSTSIVTNPYTSIDATDGISVAYNYDKDGTDAVSSSTEQFGFRWNTSTGVLTVSNGNGTYQELSDSTTVNVTAFSIVRTMRPDGTAPVVDLWESCPCLSRLSCRPGQFQNPDPDPDTTTLPSGEGSRFATRPRLTIFQYAITISGQSRSDPAVQRTHREVVRVRNDRFEGDSCVS